MNSRGPVRERLTRILCVNCGICVNTLRKYPALALDTEVTALLCRWVYPQIISEADCVCEACRDLAISSVNENMLLAAVKIEPQDAVKIEPQAAVKIEPQAEATTRLRGHTEVCLLCGCSIHRRQSDKILRENPTELHQGILSIIEISVAPRQIDETDRVCHACWLRTQREARRISSLDHASSPPVASSESIHYELQLSEDHEPSDRPSRSNPEPRTTSRQELILPKYRRAANSNNHCVFPNCSSSTLHSISDKLRSIVLSNHNYYLPSLARVCGAHLRNNSWESLYESENSITTFTVDQIQHVFSFVNAFNPTLDFENLQDMDDKVFEYWIGQTKEQFNSLMEQVPNEIRRGSLGLAALLFKKRTGDSDERISSLFQVPRRTLENLMDKVKEVLSQDSVLENLGFNNITREKS